MRIGLVIYGRLDTMSGGYLYDRQLVAHLRAAGSQVEIISLPWQSYGRHLLHNGSRLLRRRLFQSDFDILLQDELNHPSLFLFNNRLREHVRYPLIAIVHHLRCHERRPAWQNWVYSQVERIFLESVDGLIFNSRTTCSAVTQLLRHEKPYHIAMPGGDRFAKMVDPIKAEEIAKRARDPGPLRLVFAGNIIPRKGLHQLLPVLEGAQDVPWRLELVGDSEADPTYSRRVRDQIISLGLQERVVMAGVLTDRELAARLRGADLLLLPSTYEGFGIVYMEGMAFGLPAVGINNGAAPELITHGQNGFLLPADDLRPLADFLRLIAGDRRYLVQLSLAAYKRYQTHPTWGESMSGAGKFLVEMAEVPIERQ